MKVLLQRVSGASVDVAEHCVAKIGKGLLVFVGVELNDGEEEVEWLAQKVLGLRTFPDKDFHTNGKAMDQSVVESGGELLVVSQFTLAADTSKGRRPGFSTAAPPQIAEPIYERFVEKLKQVVAVQTGQFGADMQVSLVNDGPVTFLLER